MALDQLDKYSEQRTEKGHAYFRWLMLIATGAFSLTANVLFGKSYAELPLLVLKAALTANAVGILFGAIAVSGESMLVKGIVRNLCDKETHKLRGNHEAAASVPSFYTLPWYMRYIEKAFYLSLCSSLVLWVWFIWLQ
ncbi:MAG: hypothetical protein M0Q44_18435 [Methylobacter sp.]|jgi:hypothetical protein|nr:hypothetical protein [Methylobacter sp.]